MKNEKCRQYLVGRQNWIEGENKGKNMSIVIVGGNECMTCQYAVSYTHLAVYKRQFEILSCKYLQGIFVLPAFRAATG